MGSRGDQGGAEAVVSLLWEPSQGFILASIQKPATTDNIFITDRSGHTQFSQSKHYLCNTHSDEELRQGKQGPSEHPGPLGPRHPQGWPSAFGPTGYIFRKAPVITQETVCFQKPVLAAIAISKQEGENVCEGVILCVGEKRF